MYLISELGKDFPERENPTHRRRKNERHAKRRFRHRIAKKRNEKKGRDLDPYQERKDVTK